MRRVLLQGHDFDLQTLLEQFSSGDPHVDRDPDGFVLVASEFDAYGDDHVAVIARAQELIMQMNGCGVLRGGFQNVEVAGNFFDDNGRAHAVVLVDSIEIRSRVGSPVLTTEGAATPQSPPPTEGPRALASAAANPAVAAVLRLLGRGPLDWVNLYRILDHIARSAGGIDGIASAGWASKPDLKLFKRTANSHGAVGDDARHGDLGQRAPKVPMSLPNAQALVRALVSKWLAALP